MAKAPLHALPLSGLGLSLDDADDPVAALAQVPPMARPLSRDARAALKQEAETSPLVNIRSHQPVREPSEEKPEKVIRDTITLPPSDHDRLMILTSRAVAAGAPIGKSGVIRLALALLSAVPEEQFISLASALPPAGGRKRHW